MVGPVPPRTGFSFALAWCGTLKMLQSCGQLPRIGETLHDTLKSSLIGGASVPASLKAQIGNSMQES